METSVNNKCKVFTSLEQSKKLAKILPLESADMFWLIVGDTPRIHVLTGSISDYNHWNTCVAWSLSALLDVLPTKLQIVLAINDFQGDRKEKYVIGSVEHDKYDCYADNPVDACHDMIIKLHEHKIL